MEKVIDYVQALEDEKGLRWLDDNHPRRAEIRGQIRTLIAWRDEVVEHVTSLTGSDRIVRELDRKIVQRKNELLACGIDQKTDVSLAELLSLRKAAGRDCVFQVIDHPLVVWILKEKAKVLQRIRRGAKDSFRPRDNET